MYRPLIVLLGLLIATQSFAASDVSDPYSEYAEKSDYDENLEVPWIELETRVNKLPADEDLVPVRMSTLPPGMQLSIDIENATLSEDRVTRLWFVVGSESGAYNGSYEALRCESNEYKVYAYGNPKRTKPIRTVKFPSWRGVKVGNYRNELMLDYFCNGSLQRPLSDVKESLERDFTQDDPVNEHTDF